MAFLVETGTGLEGANAYISVASFNAHFIDRGQGDKVSDLDTDVIKAGIIRATDYVEKRFNKKFKGFRRSQYQTLAWPRLAAVDDDGYILDGVPYQLQKAVAEYAMLAINLTDLLPVPAYGFPTLNTESKEVSSTAGTELVRDRSKVGQVETEKWFSDPAYSRQKSTRSLQTTLVDNVQIPAYPVADLWMEELIQKRWPPRIGRA